ncbi:MAG: peptidoglycan bridge formation glycyltransferase FemA/FemB family protein [Treponema sp.]|jgi:lipid II:glycine glycyltransferase (peptidoglycan interpeptide bridge formation enzyme)|nr:peptidoglycan bridge formation glycyltransferase FemA/FemB family protein [Treponema sp.]
MRKYTKTGKLPVELNPTELSFCCRAESFLQSDFWGSFKARFGWKALAFSVEWKTPEAAFPLLVLYRRIGPGFGLAYVPCGPELPASMVCIEHERHKAAAELAAALESFLPKNTALIRFDFPWFMDESNCTIPKPFKRAALDVQPPDSVLVDLVPDEAAILGSMKSKWRYNIGLAEKKGIAVRCITANAVSADTKELDVFYRLYQETAVRDCIAIHNIEYYKTLFEEAAKHDIDVRLYLASHEGEDIAGIVTLFRNKEAVYLYGASSGHKRNLMAPYALQWQAMRDAKTAGCSYYDLYGIPPKPPEEMPDHPMAGLYRFKTGFIGDETGGRIIHRPGSWDYPCRPLVMSVYSAAEKIRKKIRDMKKRKR